MKKSVLLAAVTAVVTLTSGSVFADDAMGKCYGVVKAEKNDCVSKDKSHSCAGVATKDNDTSDWQKIQSKHDIYSNKQRNLAIYAL